jgi:hypothetical protein
LKDLSQNAQGSGVKIVLSQLRGENTTRIEFVILIENNLLGDHVLSVIKRNGQLINFDVEPRMTNVRDFQT